VRIHAQNLVNFGALPLTFSHPADYNDMHTGDLLRLGDVRRALAKGDELMVENMTRGTKFKVRHFLSPHQVRYVLRRGLVNWMKKRLAGPPRLPSHEGLTPEVRMSAQPTNPQIGVPHDDPAVPEMSTRYSGHVRVRRYQLTVRAKSGGLKVVATWQILGCEARHADHIRFRVDHRHHFEEMTVAFATTSPDVLAAIVNRLIALPWVLDAYFYP
jgi:hypothetical protein